MDEQDTQLAAILTIVTDPQMVERNIKKLQANKADVSNLIAQNDARKAEADKRHAEASALQEKNMASVASLAERETKLRNMEEHWLHRDSEQKATDAKQHERDLALNERSLTLDAREKKVRETEKTITAKAEDVEVLHAKAREHEAHAASLKKQHEEALESLRSFAGGIAKK